METGVIFNIQKFSINDGPGIRTTVFLKGCPLHCIWCHNPESHEVTPELSYESRKCIGCGLCTATCENGGHKFVDGKHLLVRDGCTRCSCCAAECVANALEMVGSKKTVSEVLETVLQDRVFYENSGGGVTLSGGEPMAQFAFTQAFLAAAKEAGLHTCMETCGYAPGESYREISKNVDLFLFDYKETNPALHAEFTGVSNERILRNLYMLDDLGCKTILRCPIIPGCNDRDDHFAGIARVANELKNVQEINVEPYHPLGIGKSERLGKEAQFTSHEIPAAETTAKWMAQITAMTQIPVKPA